MSIFITSDWHFNHNKPFIYEPRGFTSVEEMNETLIKRHNEIVNEDDEVYVLGDLTLGDITVGKNFIERMTGKLHIICGNHDTQNRIDMYKTLPNVVEVTWAAMLNYKKAYFFLTHYPSVTGTLDNGKPLFARTWNLCGHTHSQDPYVEIRKDIPSYHVEPECHNCYPVSIDNIILNIKENN